MYKWYHCSSRYGTITIKARWQGEAIKEAARRWGCSQSEVICTGWDPFKIYR